MAEIAEAATLTEVNESASLAEVNEAASLAEVNEAADSTTDVELSLTEKLHLSFATTVEKFISYIKFSKMKKSFKLMYKENPETIKNLHSQLCSQMKVSINEDLEELCKEHCVDFLLNSLENLKKSQDISQPSWRPSGDPEEDLRDHIYPIKMKHKEDLQTILTKLQMSNEGLISEASANHAEILHLKKSNDDLHEKFSNIITSFVGPNWNSLEEVLQKAVEEA